MATDEIADNDSLNVIDFLDDFAKEFNTHVTRKLQESVDEGVIPKSLILAGNKVHELKSNRLDDDYTYASIRSLSTHSFLILLDLSYNEIGDKGAVIIVDFLKHDIRLRRIILKTNNIGQTGASALGESLALNDFVEEFDILQIQSLQVNTAIFKLLLNQCSLSTNALISLSTVLSASETSRTIHVLDLSNNESSFSRLTQNCANDTMMHICKMIEVNRGIDRLGNKFTRDGGVALCQSLHKQQHLTHLNLSCCSIQDEGAEAVSVMLKYNQTLQILIAGKGLRDLTDVLFKVNKTLKSFRLWGNLWDEHACVAFAPLIGGPRNNEKEGNFAPKNSLLSHSNGTKANVVATNNSSIKPNTRFEPENVDFCFYTLSNILNVCENEDLSKNAFVLDIEAVFGK
ncbi:Leucine-rich repeat-containing protein 34 [Physocladia obscura]|uniref:Leucine-rich repeat-containing protein 34 n=1 Tax=Physocladia obscura TaxID=109957 RepID=A0AAD5XAI0_9FUNG|nr:Leucine-rich repeat-containing protein 34 [Physocladia obscura]